MQELLERLIHNLRWLPCFASCHRMRSVDFSIQHSPKITINSKKLLINFFLLLVFSSYNTSALAAFANDLDISLSHNGTLVRLYAGTNDFGRIILGSQDDGSNNLDTVFDDESHNSAVGIPPYPSDMKSLELLSNFDGNNINGQWELHLLDDFIPNKTML